MYSKNTLLRYKEIKDLYLKLNKQGLSNINIHRLHLYPKYFISIRTLYNILSTPIERDLRALNLQTEERRQGNEITN